MARKENWKTSFGPKMFRGIDMKPFSIVFIMALLDMILVAIFDPSLFLKIILIGMIVLFFFVWLLFGMENHHMWRDGGPLAQSGYEGISDNLLKCSMLYISIVIILFFPMQPPDGLIVASFIVIFTSFFARLILGWTS